MQVALDLGLLRLPLALDARFLRQGAGARPRGLDFGVGLDAPLLDIKTLGDLGILLLALDRQPLLGLLEMAAADRDIGVGLDVDARLAVFRDELGQPPHADRIECIGVVERGERRLVEPHQRHRFHHQARAREIFREPRRHGGNVARAVFVQRVHRPHRRLALHGIDQLAGKQRLHFVLAKGLGTERLGSGRDTFNGRLDADVEFERDVDAQPVGGNQRCIAGTLDRQPHRSHVHAVDLVEEGERQGTAIDDDPAAAGAGTDQGRVARRLGVEPVHDGDRYDCKHDQRENEKGPVQIGLLSRRSPCRLLFELENV